MTPSAKSASSLPKPPRPEGPLALPEAEGGEGAAAMAGPAADRAAGLQKQRSWSPDSERDESWVQHREQHRVPRGAGSLSEFDLRELCGCLDLGFEFPADEPARSRLERTFPALGLYYAVHEGGGAGKSAASSDAASEDSPVGSPHSILCPGDTPEEVKVKLKQWAQVVAMSVRNHP